MGVGFVLYSSAGWRAVTVMSKRTVNHGAGRSGCHVTNFFEHCQYFGVNFKKIVKCTVELIHCSKGRNDQLLGRHVCGFVGWCVCTHHHQTGGDGCSGCDNESSLGSCSVEFY